MLCEEVVVVKQGRDQGTIERLCGNSGQGSRVVVAEEVVESSRTPDLF